MIEDGAGKQWCFATWEIMSGSSLHLLSSFSAHPWRSLERNMLVFERGDVLQVLSSCHPSLSSFFLSLLRGYGPATLPRPISILHSPISLFPSFMLRLCPFFVTLNVYSFCFFLSFLLFLSLSLSLSLSLTHSLPLGSLFFLLRRFQEMGVPVTEEPYVRRCDMPTGQP